jgi:hypothetical protein
MQSVQDVILSLRPKKKYSLMEYIPDFGSYDNNIDNNDEHTPLQIVPETYDNDIPGSLSEQIYRDLDGPTTRNLFPFQSFFQIFCFSGRPTKTTRRSLRPKVLISNGQSIRYSVKFYLIIFIIYRILKR